MTKYGMSNAFRLRFMGTGQNLRQILGNYLIKTFCNFVFYLNGKLIGEFQSYLVYYQLHLTIVFTDLPCQCSTDELSDQKTNVQHIEEGFRGTLLTANISSQAV